MNDGVFVKVVMPQGFFCQCDRFISEEIVQSRALVLFARLKT